VLSGANDSVDIAAGAAIIAGDDEANQGKYYVRHTAVSECGVYACAGV
jgi:hypothetical protein